MGYTRPVNAARAPVITYINFHVAAKQSNREAFHGCRLMRIEEPGAIVVSPDSTSAQGQLDPQLTVWIA